MTEKEFNILLSELRALPNETEWLEFKASNGQNLGQYISGISNSACLANREFGYIVFGVEDGSHQIVGTKFKPNSKAKGNEDLIPWLARLLEPRVNFEVFDFDIEGRRVVIIRVQATANTPVKFSGSAYIRVGSYNKILDDYPEKQRLIWTKGPSKPIEHEIAMGGLVP